MDSRIGRPPLPNKTVGMAQEYIYDYLEPIPARYGLSGIVMSVFFFQCLSRLIMSLGVPKTLRPSDSWKYRNLIVSWSHAVLVTLWGITSFYYYGAEICEDLVAFHNMYIYAQISFSAGYFLYDYIDIVINVGHLAQWEVIVHHAAVGLMFFYNMMQSRCVAFSCVAITVETNTIFLHTRKLMQMQQMSFESLAYQINKYINLVTFLIFRFVPLAVIMAGMYVWGHRVSQIYFFCLGCSMFCMININIVLFWRLLRNDVLRKTTASEIDWRENHVPKTSTKVSPKSSSPILDLNEHIMQTVSKHKAWEQLQYGLNVVNGDTGKDKVL